MTGNMIYFDNNATTKLDAEVLESMMPYLTETYGNASSKLHAFGWQAQAAVEKATNQVAKLINADIDEIIFTSGATESVNLAIKGIFEAYQSKGNHIITLKTEHKAVLDVCEYLEKKKGAVVTYLEVDREGVLNVEDLKNAFNANTILVAIMAANNETGVLQEIETIGNLCEEKECVFFTDATQVIGKMRCDVQEQKIHCMAFSAHKFHGPKGIGALYIRKKNPRVSLIPQIHGGGHQQNKRSGTLNVPAIVGFGTACEIAQRDYWEINTHISKIKNYFEHQLLDIEGLHINGGTRNRLITTSNIMFPTVPNLKKLTSKIAFSSGSACSSQNAEISHVLKAMKLEEEEVKRSFRFSFSKHNSLVEVQSAINLIKESISY